MAALMINLALALLLPLAPPTKAVEREPNPLVPSLHQLSDDEEAEFDRIVDRFIRADIGDADNLPVGHHSREYRQAYDGLRKVGPDGFFALIRGFNRAARMEYSCPTQVLFAFLKRQIQGSDDPELVRFARENLGVGLINASQRPYVNAFRVVCNRRLAALGNHPRAKTQLADLRVTQEMRRLSVSQLVQALGASKGLRRKSALTELEKRDDAQALATLAAVAADPEDAQRSDARNLLVRHLLRQNEDSLKKSFKDSRPEVRIAAARAASRHQPALVKPLIDLLADEDAVVRTAAHTALVRATHKDFGPADNAPPSLRDHAIVRWRAWLGKQPPPKEDRTLDSRVLPPS